jgi:hypothetical protein
MFAKKSGNLCGNSALREIQTGDRGFGTIMPQLEAKENASTIASSMDETVLADKKISALDREKAKNAVLSRELERAHDENQKLQSEIQRTRQQLENQMMQTLQLRKHQQRQAAALTEQRALQVDANESRIADLEHELTLTQADLAKQIELAQQRESKLQKVVEQSVQYEKELHLVKQQQVQNDSNAIAVKRLERVRDELLTVVKKQMTLINVLKQQALHASAAALLEITEKDFMKEMMSDNTVTI